jgi:hypothetical protein
VAAYAQSFVCTDINYYGPNYNTTSIQKNKAKYLGSKATLTFYDKSLKISTNTDGKIESVVLEKVNNNEYQIVDKRGNNIKKMVIKLNKLVEYIRSFTVESYNNYSLEMNATFKRD